MICNLCKYKGTDKCKLCSNNFKTLFELSKEAERSCATCVWKVSASDGYSYCMAAFKFGGDFHTVTRFGSEDENTQANGCIDYEED